MNALSETRNKWGLNIFFLALAWIFAASLTIPILPLFYIDPPYFTVFVVSAIALILLAAFTWRMQNLLIFAILALLGAVWFFFLSATPPDVRIAEWAELGSDAVNTLNQFATEMSSADNPELVVASEAVVYYQGFVTTLLTIAATALSYLIIGRARWPWIMILALAGVVTANLVLGIQSHIFWLVPAAILTMLVFVWSNRIENQGSANAVRNLLHLSLQAGIPLILAMALAFVATPRLDYYNVYSPTLQKFTDDVMSLLPQNYQDKFEIFNFSIRQAGYYPLGDRLGGPLNLTNEPMLEVWGDPGYLLKGSSANIYNGAGWDNTMTNPHYRFNSAFNSSEQAEVMSTEYPLVGRLPADAQEVVFAEHSYAIRPLIDNIQVVFADGVLTDVATHREENMDFYFNQSGLVYSHDLFGGDYAYWGESYGVQSVVIPELQVASSSQLAGQPTATELDAAMGELIRADITPIDEDLAFDNYLQLPELPEYQVGGEVRALSEELIRGTRTDYESVLRLFNYLGRNPEFSYNVDVPIPAEGEEFVSHFLATKEGYCTYYATALTMMARSVGIPARYVEGFSVAPEAQDRLAAGEDLSLNAMNVETGDLDGFPSAVLTARNAHAWTEVYIRGIGWVPLDPTPGGAGGTSLPIIHDETLIPEDLTPTPSPMPDQTGTPTPTPIPEELSPSPTPYIEERPDDPTEEGSGNSFLAVLGRILRVLLIAAAIIGLGYLYYYSRLQRRETFHNPRLLSGRLRNRKDHAITYWYQILKLLALLPPGQTPQRLSLSEQMEWHLAEKEQIPESMHDDLRQAIGLTQSAYFSKHDPSEEDITNLASVYDAVETLIENKLGRGRYLFRRLLVPGSFTVTRRNGAPENGTGKGLTD